MLTVPYDCVEYSKYVQTALRAWPGAEPVRERSSEKSSHFALKLKCIESKDNHLNVPLRKKIVPIKLGHNAFSFKCLLLLIKKTLGLV